MDNTNLNNDNEGQITDKGLDTIRKITQYNVEKDLRVIENEACVKYLKIDIDKLLTATENLDKDYHKLESQIKIDQKEIEELNNSIASNRKWLELTSEEIIPTKQEQINNKQNRVDELNNENNAIYKEYIEKHEKVRLIYETHHRLFKRLKQLNVAKLKLWANYKMLQQKIIEQKKINKQKRKINDKIFNVTNIYFVQTVKQYWETRDVINMLKQAEKPREILIKEMRELDLFIAKKNKEMQQNKTISHSYASNEVCEFPMEYLVPSEPYPEFSFAPVNTCNRMQHHQMLQQLQNKCDERQQEWCQRPSFSSGVLFKRPLSNSNIRAVNSKRAFLQKSPIPQVKNSKANIIDVQIIPNKEAAPIFKQPEILKEQLTQYKQQNVVSQPPSIIRECLQSEKLKEQISSSNASHQGASQQNIFTQSPSTFKQAEIIIKENMNYNQEASQQNFPPRSSVIRQPMERMENLSNDITCKTVPQQPQQMFSQRSPIFTQAQPMERNKNLSNDITCQTVPQQPQQIFSQRSAIFTQSMERNKNLSIDITRQHQATPQRPQQSFTPCPSIFAQPMEQNRNLNNIQQAAASQQNIFAQPQSHGINKNLLQYRLQQNVPSQLEFGISQHMNSQTQNSFTSTFGMTPSSQSGATQNLHYMHLTESQPEQNKTQNNTVNDSIRTSQNSTFSQKCQQLPQILAKDVPEGTGDVISTPATNPATTEIITSPFFTQPKIQAAPKAGDSNTQIPTQPDMNVFANQSFDVDALLENSAYEGEDMEENISNEDDPYYAQACLSPTYPMQEDTNKPTEPTESQPNNHVPFSVFNFGQPQPQSNENRSVFGGNFFNTMF